MIPMLQMLLNVLQFKGSEQKTKPDEGAQDQTKQLTGKALDTYLRSGAGHKFARELKDSHPRIKMDIAGIKSLMRDLIPKYGAEGAQTRLKDAFEKGSGVHDIVKRLKPKPSSPKAYLASRGTSGTRRKAVTTGAGGTYLSGEKREPIGKGTKGKRRKED